MFVTVTFSFMGITEPELQDVLQRLRDLELRDRPRIALAMLVQTENLPKDRIKTIIKKMVPPLPHIVDLDDQAVMASSRSPVPDKKEGRRGVSK